MIGRAIISALLFAASGSAGAQAPTPVQTQAETEVRAFIERYNGYYGANDLDPYFASFDPALTQWWPEGRVDLPTYERDWRKTVASGGGNAGVTVTDLRVQIDPTGDAAVATYILEVTPRRDGKAVPTIERNQETDVLFKRGGKWTIVHVNYAPVTPPERQPAE